MEQTNQTKVQDTGTLAHRIIELSSDPPKHLSQTTNVERRNAAEYHGSGFCFPSHQKSRNPSLVLPLWSQWVGKGGTELVIHYLNILEQHSG